jgi:hypothetical protein
MNPVICHKCRGASKLGRKDAGGGRELGAQWVGLVRKWVKYYLSVIVCI